MTNFNVTEKQKQELQSMSECIFHERLSIIQKSENAKVSALAWATACAEESIYMWRTTTDQDMVIFMLEFLLDRERKKNGQNLQKDNKGE